MKASRGLGLGAASVGLLVLAGWALGLAELKSGLPGLPTVKPNTALALVLLGLALGWAGRPRVRLALAAAGAGIGGLTLVEYAGLDLGIDPLLFREPPEEATTASPGRMPPATALSLLLLGAALIRVRALAFPALLLASLSLLGYLFRGATFRAPLMGAGWETYMALPTTLALGGLALGILLEGLDRGLLASGGSAGSLARLLLLSLPPLLVGLGWLRVMGEERGWFGRAIGLASFTLLTVLLASGLVVWMARGIWRHEVEGLRLQERLKAGEERLRRILDSAYDAFVVIDAEGRIADWNRQAERLFGWSREEAIGRRLSETLIPAAYRAAHEAGLKRFRETGAGPVLNQRLELSAVDRSGREFPVELTIASPVPSEGRVYFHAFLRDITERKRAEEALRSSEERFRLLVDGVEDYAILMLDPEGRVASWNPGAERMKGWRSEEILGRDFSAFYTEEDRAQGHPSRELETARGKGHYEEEGWRVRKDGSRFWASVSLTAVRDPAGVLKGFAKVTRDVSERRRMESDLQEANRELEAFSYSVSHDLRAPLRAIAGFSRILVEDHAPRLGAEGARVVGVIQEGARRMGQLIDDLLSFSRTSRQPLRRAEVDMEALVLSVWEELKAAEPARAAELRLGPLPPARGDPTMLRQVWTNLLSNALKYSRKADPARIEASGEARDGCVRYEVRDNGVGFDMAYVSKLFGVFQRLHSGEEFEGTGVGLALVKRIVQRHGGEVWARGRPGGGAGFGFSLPDRKEAS